MRKSGFIKPLLLLICTLCTVVLFAQDFELENNPEPEEEPEIILPVRIRQDFFFGISGDVSFYSANGFSYGGGLLIGYGTGSAVGIIAAWFFSAEKINTLELNLFLRFYFFGREANKGPYLQLMGGPVLFFENGHFRLPARVGSFSGGLGLGWRFIIANRLYIEPFVRGGYPYIVSGGITAGIRL